MSDENLSIEREIIPDPLHGLDDDEWNEAMNEWEKEIEEMGKCLLCGDWRSVVY